MGDVTPELWKQIVCAKGCALAGQDEFHDTRCDGPIQGHHVLSQQQLRKHGFERHLWDTWNGMALCYRHHRRHDNATERVPYSKLTAANHLFADALGLGYLLDRYYPKENIMSEPVDSSSPEYLHPAEHSQVAEAVAGVGAVMDGPAQVERCPTCERALPKPHLDEAEKVRRGWTIAVPVDEQENGADVLDSLLDECRKIFGHDTNRKVRYYTIVQALAVVVQNQTRLVADDAA